MHSIGDYQDIRFRGSLSVYMPFTSLCLMVSNFALCGMPFFGWVLFEGFYFVYIVYDICKYIWVSFIV
jgi:NADH:ubiquinone oxidoreductase subunit 5 (subunit L)/multisubunit Na+/H+ antiporter MnhA subunit